MIPVTFNKDDLQNEKKGTIRAQDLASMVGLVYPKKVGVLDIFDNPISVTNVDLSTTGYVKLTFSKGYVVVYGRLIYIEQGELVTLPLPASTESGNIGISINLAESGASEVEWFMKSGTLTTNNLLNESANGVYEFAIYSYTANSTSFTLGAKIAPVVPSIEDYLKGANFTTQPVADNSTKLATTEFVKKNIQDKFFTSLATDGEINIGNLLIKWGFCVTPPNASVTRVTWNNPFRSIYVVLVTPYNNLTNDAWVQLTLFDVNGFNYRSDRDKTNCMYIAIGERRS